MSQPFTNPASISGAATAGTPLHGLQTQRVLGESASGPTFLAFQLTALEGGAIAVKRYNARFTKYVMGDPPALERLGAFQGKPVPGLPTILRAGIVRDELLILMEGNDGEPLDLVMPHGGFPRDTAIRLIGQLAGALATMHAGGLLHLNVHPGSIVLFDRGKRASFVDWGHTVPQVRIGETIGGLPGFGFGGLGYASAELLAGASPDGADDVFSIACVAYEMLTGRHPFDRRSPSDAIEQGMQAAPIQNFDLARNAMLLRALALKRDDRSATMDELAEAFGAPRPRPAAAGRPTLRDGLRHTFGFERAAAPEPVRPPTPTPAAPPAPDFAPDFAFDRGSGLNLGMDEALKRPLIASLNQGGPAPSDRTPAAGLSADTVAPRTRPADTSLAVDFERDPTESTGVRGFHIAVGLAAVSLVIAGTLMWLKAGGAGEAAGARPLPMASTPGAPQVETGTRAVPTPESTVGAPIAEITSSTAVEAVPPAPRAVGRERDPKPASTPPREDRTRMLGKDRDPPPFAGNAPAPAVAGAPPATAPATPVTGCPTCHCPTLREKRFLAEQPLTWEEASYFLKACGERG